MIFTRELLYISQLDNQLLVFDDQTVLSLVIRLAPGEFRQNPDRVRLEPCGLHAERADLLLFKFKTYESDTPYHFHWRLQRQSADVFCAMVTKSLMVNMLHSQRKCTQLLDVIRRKDVEIEQYKLAGAQILRSNQVIYRMFKPHLTTRSRSNHSQVIWPPFRLIARPSTSLKLSPTMPSIIC